MIGSIIGLKYEVTQDLGSDGIFDVYRAVDRTKNRSVKLRLIRDQFAKEDSFRTELLSILKIHETFQHHGLERVYESRQDEDGTWFIVTEFEEGAVLEERLRRLTSFSIPGALSTSVAIVEALDACHSVGLIHGDVSTRTVFTKQSDGVKLMCAGFWRAYAYSESAARTMMPAMAPYLAPEITTGTMPNEQTDIYAVGVVLFKLMSGRYPYPGESPAMITQLHASGPVPSLRVINSSVPQPLDNIIQKCLAKNPRERYPNAKALLHDLRMLQDALRFGRPIKWPLDSQGSESEAITVLPAKERTGKTSYPAPVPIEESKRKKPEPLNAEPEKEPIGYRILSVVGYLALAVVILLVGFWAFFQMSTPSIKEVPNLIGMNEKDAEAQLKKLGIKLKVKEAASEKPKGTIIKLEPGPGLKIRENWPLEATVSAGGRYVEMPDLRGRTVEDARRLLASMDLELSDDIQYIYDRALEPQQIAQQVPESRKKVERMTKVRIRVNSGIKTDDDPDQPRKSGAWHRYSLEIPLPSDGDKALDVRVEMDDDKGTTVVHDEKHAPGETFRVKVDGQGEEVTFRIFVNEQLYDQVTQSAAQAVDR